MPDAFTTACRYYPPSEIYPARIVLPRSLGVVRFLAVRPTKNRKTGRYDASVFLVDERSHLRLYSVLDLFAVDKPPAACVEGVYPLFERPTDQSPVRGIALNEPLQLLTVIAERHTQRVPYRQLCGALLWSACQQSVFCREHTKYCVDQRRQLARTVDACVPPHIWDRAASPGHPTDPYPCDQTASGCLVPREGQESDSLACPREFCMCQVRVWPAVFV